MVGELPEDQQYEVPGAPEHLGPIRYVVVFAEDNDGQPGDLPDRAFPALLFELTGERVCAGLTAFYASMVPVERGNVVVRDAAA